MDPIVAALVASARHRVLIKGGAKIGPMGKAIAKAALRTDIDRALVKQYRETRADLEQSGVEQ